MPAAPVSEAQVDEHGIVWSALTALADKNRAVFETYFDEALTYEAPPNRRIVGRSDYLTEISSVLEPGSRGTLKSFELVHVGSPSGSELTWIRASLSFELMHRPKPDAELQVISTRSEVWFGVRGDQIVGVKALNLARDWNASGSS